MPERERPRTAIVGAGRLARSLFPPLVQAGYPVTALVARKIAAARAIGRGRRGTRATTSLRVAASEARLLLLAVSDPAIGPLASRLAALPGIAWRGRIVLHHAAALGPSVLAPLARRGAATGVLHPLQVLGGPAASAVLAGSRALVDGDRVAVALARRLARDLGLVPLAFPRPPRASDRIAYHAAAAIAANDVVGLLSLAVELLESIGFERGTALRALTPLVHGVVAQIERGGLASALTGPAARGDARTLVAHLRRVGQHDAEGAEAHRLLSRRLLRLAGRSRSRRL
jgi:predicted short-subunit dehydrogenase-like oxidoreductase (DUF2520 family)